jgi:hypothetical protein
MDHEARMDVARHLIDWLKGRHGEDLLGVALYGSMAHHEDGEHSDVEVWAVLRGGEKAPDIKIIHDGMIVEVNYFTKAGAEAAASTTSGIWPISVDGWKTTIPLHDPEDLFPHLAKLGEDVDTTKLLDGLGPTLVNFFESLCKMRNAVAAGEDTFAKLWSSGMAIRAAVFLALLNGQHFNGTRNLLTKPKDFRTLPDHFWEDYLPLAGGDGSAAELLEHAERLYRGCYSLWSATGRAFPEGVPLEDALDHSVGQD